MPTIKRGHRRLSEKTPTSVLDKKLKRKLQGMDVESPIAVNGTQQNGGAQAKNKSQRVIQKMDRKLYRRIFGVGG